MECVKKNVLQSQCFVLCQARTLQQLVRWIRVFLTKQYATQQSQTAQNQWKANARFNFIALQINPKRLTSLK